MSLSLEMHAKECLVIFFFKVSTLENILIIKTKYEGCVPCSLEIELVNIPRECYLFSFLIVTLVVYAEICKVLYKQQRVSSLSRT